MPGYAKSTETSRRGTSLFRQGGNLIRDTSWADGKGSARRLADREIVARTSARLGDGRNGRRRAKQRGNTRSLAHAAVKQIRVAAQEEARFKAPMPRGSRTSGEEHVGTSINRMERVPLARAGCEGCL